MLRTEICDLFGIEYPVVLAGMGGVCMAELVAAVSNAGGLGVIGAATLDPKSLRQEIRRTRELTDKPFAVDLLAPLPQMFEPHMPVLFEEKVPVFVAGLAVPRQYIGAMHDHGMKVMVMCGQVKHALRAEEAGADVVAAQGTDAGGHTGEIGVLSLVPQVVDAVKTPVLAAGGIVDGRGIVAALALGAQGVIIGTRFIATYEAQAAKEYKEAILRAGDADTIRTRCYTGKPVRAIRNRYIEEWERKPTEIKPFPDQIVVSLQNRVLNYAGPEPADPERTCMPAGQGSGLIKEIQSAGDVLRELVAEAEEVLQNRVLPHFRPNFVQEGRLEAD